MNESCIREDCPPLVSLRRDVKDLSDAFRLLEERQVGFEMRFEERASALRDVSNANLQMMTEVRRRLDDMFAQNKELKLMAERAERIAKSRVSRHDLEDAKDEMVTASGHKALQLQRDDLEKLNNQLRAELNAIIDGNRKKEESRAAERRAEVRRWRWTVVGAAITFFITVSSGIAVSVYNNAHTPPPAVHAGP